MINKLKIAFLVTVLSLAIGVSNAHAFDVTFSNDTPITLTTGPIGLVIAATSTASALTVNATQLIVTVPANASFILIAPGRNVLTNDLGLAQSCNGSQNSVTINSSSVDQTVTFTPTAAVCAFGGSGGLVTDGGASSGNGSTPSGSSSGSSSSSGGSNSAPVTLTITPVTATPTVVAGCTSNIGFSTSTGASCAGNTSVTITPTSIPGCGNGTFGFSVTTGGSCSMNSGSPVYYTYNFGTVTLRNGSTGAAVMELQRFLNAKLNLGLIIDGKLGPKTIAVIKTWQKNHGLVADGLIGVKTKAMMNAEASY